ncbi:hypothetical protein AN960_22535 [Bacillus sp. FJAT-25509]|nr:hypothetical protein AN960_22535 [Bacillus sp. FJAT-25509]
MKLKKKLLRLIEELEDLKSEDGVIEAIEIPGERFIVGVQWRPEMMQRNKVNHSVIFESFIKERSLRN